MDVSEIEWKVEYLEDQDGKSVTKVTGIYKGKAYHVAWEGRVAPPLEDSWTQSAKNHVIEKFNGLSLRHSGVFVL